VSPVVTDRFVWLNLLSARADDRRPIDPPPIVQLRVIDRGGTDPATPRSSSSDAGGA
jgi:hypothetical protein